MQFLRFRWIRPCFHYLTHFIRSSGFIPTELLQRKYFSSSFSFVLPILWALNVAAPAKWTYQIICAVQLEIWRVDIATRVRARHIQRKKIEKIVQWKPKNINFYRLKGQSSVQQIATNTTNSATLVSFCCSGNGQMAQKKAPLEYVCLHSFVQIRVRAVCTVVAVDRIAKNAIFVKTWNWKPIISVAVKFSRVLMHTAKYCNTILWCQTQRAKKGERASERANGQWRMDWYANEEGVEQ